MANKILGVNFKNNANTVEHQWFPPEYFTGSDVTIYMGDIFLSEVSMLSFTLEEKVLPIYGYASYTADEVARGSRIVTGQFAIPFTEAGYLEAILTHIGQHTTETEKVKPKLAYKKAEETVPNWCSEFKMDVEGYYIKQNNKGTKTNDPLADLRAEMPNGNLVNGIPIMGNGQNSTVDNTTPVYVTGGTGKQYNVTYEGAIVIIYPDEMNLPPKNIKPGVSGYANTRAAMELDTKMTYNEIKEITQILPAKSKGYDLIYSGGDGVHGTSVDAINNFNDRVAKYEKEIWGRESSEDKDRKYQTFFCTDRERVEGVNAQEILKKKGFDIYITYGPMADAEKYNTWEKKDTETPSLDTYTFSTTVKAIRGIHLTSTGQTIQADGEPVMEVYTFIATDLD